MSNTFAHRRQDVVTLQLSVREIEEKWPALFDVSQVKAEFHRITTVNLESKFMSMLDHYTPKLLAIFQAKKGAAGERHRTEMNLLLQSGIPIEKTREVVIRCLIDHLGEDVGALINELENFDSSSHRAINVEEELAAETMALFLVRDESGQVGNVGIVIESAIVLDHLGDLSRACCYLLGLTYALDFHPSIHLLSLPVSSIFGSRGSPVPISSNHCAMGGVHPGRVASPSQGHIETNETNNHTLSHSHLWTI